MPTPPIFGMFIGASSPKAALGKLKQAEKMEKAGASAEKIADATGWYRAPWDKKWRMEISDEGAKLFRNEKGEWVFEHKALFDAYPELRKIPIKLSLGKNASGGKYTPDTGITVSAENEKGAIGTILHEFQHAIQDIEGWGRGADPAVLERSNDPEVKKRIARLGADATYEQVAGEVESRLTSHRNMYRGFGWKGENFPNYPYSQIDIHRFNPKDALVVGVKNSTELKDALEMPKPRVTFSPLGTATAQTGPLTLGASPAGASATIGGRSGNLEGQAGVAVNPWTGSIGPTASVGAQIGDNTVRANTSLGPTVQFGNEPENAQAAQIGAIISSTLPGGAVVGSAIGSAAAGAFGSRNHDHRERRRLRSGLRDSRIIGQDDTFLNPDGTVGNLGFDGSEGIHNWRDPSRRVDKEGNRPLSAYDTDYTNDMDYVSNMVGNSLSRLLHGGKNKAIDQMGSAWGNQLLGSVGYGADLTQQNFSTVMNNGRAAFARAGIQNKEEMLSLAGQMHSEGRINDADYAALQQTSGILFDNDFNSAQALMAGRWRGIETAGKTPSARYAPRSRGGTLFTPVLSPEEALMYMKPLYDRWRSMYGGRMGGNRSTAELLTEGLGLISALGGARRSLTPAYERIRDYVTTPDYEEGGGFLPAGGNGVAPERPPLPVAGIETNILNSGSGTELAALPEPSLTPEPVGAGESPFWGIF